MSAVRAEGRLGPASPFAPGTVLALLVVSLVAFVGLAVLAAYGPSLQGGQGGGANVLSRSAIGYAGIARLLRDTGHTVSIERGQPPADGVRPTAGLLVLTPTSDTDAAQLARLIARERRTVLVIAPKWLSAPDPSHPGWAMGLGPAPAFSASSGLRLGTRRPALQRRPDAPAIPSLVALGDFSALGALPVGPISAFQTGAWPDAANLIVDDQGRPVLSHGEAQPYLLSDPDLMNDLGLADARTARTAVTLMEVLAGSQGPIAFDVSLDGLGRPRSLLGLALAPPFLGATLCLLAAALLMGAHAAVRFGPARGEGRALALGKSALLDNAAMLIGLAKREPAMGRRYAALVRRTLVQRTLARRPGGAPADAALDSALDRLTPRADPPFAALAGEAERAHDVPALMRAVRALHQRQTEILGERS